MTTTEYPDPHSAIPSTLPSPRPWYAEGTTADFSMSDLFAFAQVLDNLGAFEDVSSVLYYFEKPWKWTGERARWVQTGEPSQPDEDQAEYILDNGTTAESFAAWKDARHSEISTMADIALCDTQADRTKLAIDGKNAGTLADFLVVNAETLHADDVDALNRLEIGQSLLLGRETVTRTR